MAAHNLWASYLLREASLSRIDTNLWYRSARASFWGSVFLAGLSLRKILANERYAEAVATALSGNHGSMLSLAWARRVHG
jgi:hypothetical protein